MGARAGACDRVSAGPARILVTGAAGFVGANFLRRASAMTTRRLVAAINRRQPNCRFDGIEYVDADLTRLEHCRRIVEDIDYVCMFAGRLSTGAILRQSALGPVTENTVVNVNMLQAAADAGVAKFLWLSSTTGYPESRRPLIEDEFDVGAPPAPYEAVGWMSRYVEQLGRLYATKPARPMTVIALRPTAVFGEHDDFELETCHVLPALVRRVVERQTPLEIRGNGEQRRDWLYVDDLIDACLLSLEKVDGFAAFNIGSGRAHTVNELATWIMEMDGFRDGQVVHRPVAGAALAEREVDCSLARKALGFAAKTPMQTALARTITWYRSHADAVLTAN